MQFRRPRNIILNYKLLAKICIFILFLLYLSWYIMDLYVSSSDTSSPPPILSSQQDIYSTFNYISTHLPDHPVSCHAGPFDSPLAKTAITSLHANFSKAFFFTSKPYTVDYYNQITIDDTKYHNEVLELMDLMKKKAEKVEKVEIFIDQMPYRQCDLLIVGGTNYQTLSRQLLRLRKSCHYKTEIILFQYSDRPLDQDQGLARILKDRYSLEPPVCPYNSKFCFMRYHSSNFIPKYDYSATDQKNKPSFASTLHEPITFDDFERNTTMLKSELCSLPSKKSSVLSNIERHAYDYGGYMLLSPTNEGFFAMTHCADCSLRSAGIHSILYLAFDNKTVDRLERLNQERKQQGFPPIVYYKQQTSTATRSEMTYYKQRAFLKLMWERLQVQKSLLELGIDVLLSDSDIIHSENPLKAFRRDMAEQGTIKSPSSDDEDDFDMIIQTDLYSIRNYSQFAEPPEGCGGYFFLRSTLASMRMLDDMIKAYAEHPTKKNAKNEALDDQDVLNLVMKSEQACAYNVGPKPFSCDHRKFEQNKPKPYHEPLNIKPHIGWKFHYLQQERFINGHTRKQSWKIAQQRNSFPTIFHANGQGPRKKSVLESFGLWPVINGTCMPHHIENTKLKWRK